MPIQFGHSEMAGNSLVVVVTWRDRWQPRVEEKGRRWRLKEGQGHGTAAQAPRGALRGR